MVLTLRSPGSGELRLSIELADIAAASGPFPRTAKESDARVGALYTIVRMRDGTIYEVLQTVDEIEDARAQARFAP